jgi:hypothetical protein
MTVATPSRGTMVKKDATDERNIHKRGQASVLKNKDPLNLPCASLQSSLLGSNLRLFPVPPAGDPRQRNAEHTTLLSSLRTHL